MAAGVNNVAVVGWAGRGPISCSESCIMYTRVLQF